METRQLIRAMTCRTPAFGSDNNNIADTDTVPRRLLYPERKPLGRVSCRQTHSFLPFSFCKRLYILNTEYSTLLSCR
uniref:Uncharacterized protein n=1 Tax=Oryza brachyantha TaxID=4533 RepID=J3MFZ3_ORYBR